MSNFLKNRWMLLTFRILLGGIFFVASISKILDMSGFVDTVAGYELIPQTLAEIYGWVMPWVELCLGCSLILGIFPRISAGISIPVIVSFASASGYALEKVPDSICGCFGSFIILSHPVSLTIDAFMFLFGLTVLTGKQTEFFSVGQWFSKINPELKNQKKLSYYTVLLGVVTLAMGVTAAVSYGVELIIKQDNNVDSYTIEAVDIPTPMADKVITQLQQYKPVLLYVFAEGCASCEATEPIVEEVVEEYDETIAYIKIDYYQYTDEITEMGITSTPTIWLIIGQNNDGTFILLKRFNDIVEPQELKSAIDGAIEMTRQEKL